MKCRDLRAVRSLLCTWLGLKNVTMAFFNRLLAAPVVRAIFIHFCSLSFMSARQHIYFQGRVQGVGFRFTARSLAEGFAVTGFVRNLSNGEVELVAEGAATEFESFLSALREEMSDNIAAERVFQSTATNEHSKFEIHF